MDEHKDTYVQLEHIHKTYKKFKASDDINFSIKQGRLIALLGPSGSGKTTILNMIAGLETPDLGNIYLDGKKVNDVVPSKRGIGFVFQSYALFRYMTVYDNIAFGLKVAHWKKPDIKKRVGELIALVNLEGFENRYPSQLSGGQRQRVAFARALAPNPELLLLDEPFAAIDAKVRKELRTWLRDMITKVGITSIFVTHDQEEAIEVADEIIITNHGRVEQIGTPLEIYTNPKTPFVARFIGQTTRVANISAYTGFEGIPAGFAAYVRPENIMVTKKGETNQYTASAQSGHIEHVLFRGKEIQLTVRVGEVSLTAIRRLEEEPVSIGEEVAVFIHRVYAFDESQEECGGEVIAYDNENLDTSRLISI